MLRRTFLKAVIAATAAKFLPSRLANAEPIQIGYAHLVKDTGEIAQWSKTPIWTKSRDWRQRLSYGESLQFDSIEFGRMKEAMTCSAIRIELEGCMPEHIPMPGAKKTVIFGDEGHSLPDIVGRL